MISKKIIENYRSLKKNQRRRFIPFVEKLQKIRGKIGDLVINQTQIQVLLIGLISLRSQRCGFINSYTKRWSNKLESKTLGELIFIFQGYALESEISLIKKLEEFNNVRNRIMHRINFYEGLGFAITLGKRNFEFKELKQDIIKVNKAAPDLIKSLQELAGEEIKLIFRIMNQGKAEK